VIRQVRLADRPEGEDHQRLQGGHLVDEQIERLTSGGIAPMNVLEPPSRTDPSTCANWARGA
jgi:hypothetical protein